MSRTIRIPLFPLGGALLFPRSQLPLHIFEPRYRAMVSDAVAGSGRIGMIQPLRDDDDNLAPLHSVGCVGEIGGVEELDDGRFNIVLVGTDRFRLVTEAPLDEPYRIADVDIGAFDDREPDPLALAQRAEVEREARRYADALGYMVEWEQVSRLDDEMLVNGIAQIAPLDPGSKQALLEATRIADRADLLV
jgi:uncharacterized protein